MIQFVTIFIAGVTLCQGSSLQSRRVIIAKAEAVTGPVRMVLGTPKDLRNPREGARLKPGPVPLGAYLFCPKGSRAKLDLRNGKTKSFDKATWTEVPVTSARRSRVARALASLYEIGGTREGQSSAFWFPLRGKVWRVTLRVVPRDYLIQAQEIPAELRVVDLDVESPSNSVSVASLRQGLTAEFGRLLTKESFRHTLKLEIVRGGDTAESPAIRLLDPAEERELRADLAEVDSMGSTAFLRLLLRAGVFLQYELRTDAATELERALALHPSDVDTLTSLRNAYRAGGNSSGADYCTYRLAQHNDR